MNKELANKITTSLIAKIKENKTLPWQKPWNIAGPTSLNGPKPYYYTGINWIMLSMDIIANNRQSTGYVTFNTIKKFGGHIKAGSKGIIVVYASKTTREKTVKDKDGNETIEEVAIPFTKYYYVFSIEDCEFSEAALKKLPKVNFDRIEFVPAIKAEEIIDNLKNNHGLQLKYEGNAAFYNNHDGCITTPPREQFKSIDNYYATLFHEVIHWTAKALKRNLADYHDDIKARAREELTAEIGAAMLCAHLGIDNTFENSTAYVNGWINALERDPDAITDLIIPEHWLVSVDVLKNNLEKLLDTYKGE